MISITNVLSDPNVPDVVRTMFDDNDGRPLVSVAVDLNGDGVREKFIPNEM